MKRNPAIELYRILAMLGICILHGSIIRGHAPRAWWINLWPWCVNAFVFITGYFGCTFKPSKILRLYGTALFAAFSIVAVNQIWGGYLICQFVFQKFGKESRSFGFCMRTLY